VTAPGNRWRPRAVVAAMLAGAFAVPAEAMLQVNPAAAALQVLAYPVVSGRVGPFRDARVYLAYADPANRNGFAGSVLAAGKHYPLPDPDEPPDFFATNVRAVMFAEADHTPGNELLVLYSAIKTAPDSAGYTGVVGYHWDGHAFVRLRALEHRLEGSRSAADVRRRLARMGVR
jgi:hypothetical protein